MWMFDCLPILALLVPFMTCGQQISMLYESPTPANSTAARMNDSTSFLCSVAIVIDSSFFVSVANSSSTNALQLVKDWMTEVDQTFRSADFNNDTFADNVGLQIVKIALYQDVNDPTLKNATKTPIQMLSGLSKNDYIFKGSCVGLHLMHHSSTTSHSQLKASITSPERGICSESRNTPLQVDPLAKSDFGSNIYNSVPVNFKDVDGARAIAHQLGHLFGALDDEDYAKEGFPCSKNISAGDRDNFVMLESGLGKKGDHMVWSNCSLMAINEFLGFKKKASMKCLQECSGDECAVILAGNRHNETTKHDEPDAAQMDGAELRSSARQHAPNVTQKKTTPKADTKVSKGTKVTPTLNTASFGMATTPATVTTKQTTPTVAPIASPATSTTSRRGLSSYDKRGKSSTSLVKTTTKSIPVTSSTTTTEVPSNQPAQSDNQSVDSDGKITNFTPLSDDADDPTSTPDPNDTFYSGSNSSATTLNSVIGYGKLDFKLFLTAFLTLSNVVIYM